MNAADPLVHWYKCCRNVDIKANYTDKNKKPWRWDR